MISLDIHHIGYLVKHIDQAIKGFTDLGYSIEQDILYDPLRRINICFLIKDGYRVELVSPTDSDSVVANLIKKYKNMPYHICYESKNLKEDLAFLTSNGYMAIDIPANAPACDNRFVVFLIHPQIGMIELIDMQCH